jgi:glyoxylase-like metal-dependent hydrolase (beta-lactamase superfamily II)
MNYTKQLSNIYVVDTKMFGFDQYHAAYLVEGKEIALIDTGLPSQTEAVLTGIKAHGFSISDISYIFVTHCEHGDHSGNVAPLLRGSIKASVYINPVGINFLTNPSEEESKLKDVMTTEMIARIGKAEPVPPSRIKLLNDGDVFDLGNGEKLKVIFAPGHQPSGIVILEEKNKGLFINDLVGNCFTDADAHYVLNPYRSDHIQAIASLQKLMELPVDNLCLGHYGICDRPKQVMTRAIESMQELLDVGRKYVSEGKPEKIASKAYEIILPELEKLKVARGELLYEYAKEHVSSQAKLFTKYCQDRFSK